MVKKRFELKVNKHNQCDIIDWEESEKKNAICIYNDLGDYYSSSAMTLCKLLNELYEENKEFKQVTKEVLKLLEEEVDLFSDKAIEHDIQAYIELRELDNKDAYYMAISTKKVIKLLKEMIK